MFEVKLRLSFPVVVASVAAAAYLTKPSKLINLHLLLCPSHPSSSSDSFDPYFRQYLTSHRSDALSHIASYAVVAVVPKQFVHTPVSPSSFSLFFSLTFLPPSSSSLLAARGRMETFSLLASLAAGSLYPNSANHPSPQSNHSPQKVILSSYFYE